MMLISEAGQWSDGSGANPRCITYYISQKRPHLIFTVPQVIFLMQNSCCKQGTGCCSNLLVRYAVETGTSELLQQRHALFSTVCSIMWII